VSTEEEGLREVQEARCTGEVETGEEYRHVLDLPGVTADTIDVTVEGGRLRIDGQRTKDVPGEFTFVREDRSVFLDAEIPLPPDTTGQGGEGTVENGVLELRLPKATAAPSTTIPIDGN
jgi:HSP20 family molecular chaperone IbpA